MKIGYIVAFPWGLDEVEGRIIDIYHSAGRERVTLAVGSACPACGQPNGNQNSFSIPMDYVQLLPAKPAGLWLKRAKKR